MRIHADPDPQNYREITRQMDKLFPHEKRQSLTENIKYQYQIASCMKMRQIL
jgi:hypothetical protein